MLSINQNFIDKIYQHSLDEFPNECCGILAGKNDIISNIYLIKNTANSPYRYLMDSRDFLNADKNVRDKNIDFIAFYHSHTHSKAYPSDTDVRMAVESGWTDIIYALISLEDKDNPVLKIFLISESGNISEEKLNITK
ncbi:MAG: M67 family metallopeptidase [Dehalococcoidia bacterium]